MKDILFKRPVTHHSINYANLCVVCLHLHPQLIETNFSQIIHSFLPSDEHLSVFLIGYIDLYFRMRSLSKLTKRLTNVFDKSFLLPSNVREQWVEHNIDFKHDIFSFFFCSYRTCIAQCTHTLIEEIWSSLLENKTAHWIVIQFLGALLDGYRLFDLNISRENLVEQNQGKYQRTLEKLREYVNETVGWNFDRRER